MLNIQSILSFMLNNLGDKERFHKINDEHIVDTKTGVELHLYDDWFKMTHGDSLVASTSDFTQDEKEIIWKIKQSFTDPLTAQEMQKRFYERVEQNRQKLADLYENPQPIAVKKVSEEDDTEEYTG